MAKENDLLLNLLVNPTFDAFDFKAVGLDASNTSLESKDVYKDIDYVKNNPLLQTNGAFDETKFNNLYTQAVVNFNLMANNEVGELIGRHANFYKTNFYAPRSQVNTKPETEMIRINNPLREGYGITSHIDAITENPLSLREIALNEKVWDVTEQKWKDAPNDGTFFSRLARNFGKTLVLAQYDEDGWHEDPYTGEMVEHKKGNKKLNKAGTFYYETLGGRSVYGRDVLSKWDTLTVDGSTANKFDFIDADSKESNILPTIIRDAIKVVPAFIPGVNTWYLGLRVAMNVTDLLATIGNMVTNEAPVFNGINGYINSLGYSTSDYAQEHPWSLENILNMGSDVFLQLAEQRWMFKYPASIFKGKYGISEENQAKLFSEKLAEQTKKSQDIISKAATSGKYVDAAKMATEMPAINLLYAAQLVSNYMKNYYQIGSKLSMAYMTGVTVKDSYGEAKAEGATGLEAALLTLGYAAGEYAIIKSDLGKWILPELRGETNRWKLVVKELSTKHLTEAENLITLDKNKLVDWAKRVLHLGKTKALQDYSKDTLKLTGKAMVANALGEGVEETVEELLYDGCKSLSNFLSRIAGSDTELTAFDNGDLSKLFNRYALSFVGGVIGGGLGQARGEFRLAAALRNIDAEKAFGELVNIVKDGKADEFLDVVDKTTWASNKLSFTPADIEYDAYGEKKDKTANIYAPASSTDKSQNLIIKDFMHQEVDFIKGVLAAEGASVSENSLIRQITSIEDPLKEFRAAALSHSVFARSYGEEYGKAIRALVEAKRTLKGIEEKIASAKDSEKAIIRESLETKDAIDTANKSITEARKVLKSYQDGEKLLELTKQVLFETSAPIQEALEHSRLTLAAYLTGKYRKSLDKLTETEISEGTEEFKKIQESSEGIEALKRLYQVFTIVNDKASEAIKKFSETYFQKDSIIGSFKDIVSEFVTETQRLSSEKALDRYEQQYTGVGLIVNFLLAAAKNNNIPINADDIWTIAKLDPKTTQGYADKIQLFRDLITKVFRADIDNGKKILQEALNSLYITAAVKEDLFNTLRAVKEFFIWHNDEEDEDYDLLDTEVRNYLDEIKKAVENTKYSPISEFLDLFSIAANDQLLQFSISQLIITLDQQFRDAGRIKALNDISFSSPDVEQQISNAINIIELAKASVEAARTDGASAANAFGYNKTLNDLDSKSKLAEIDKNIANTIVQELDLIKDRLTYYKNLIDINSGNKLNQYSRTSVRSLVLFFDKIFKRFTSVDRKFPPESWTGADSFRDLLNDPGKFLTLKLLRGGLDVENYNWILTEQQQEKLQEEIKELWSGIHELFSKNADVVKSPEKLADLLDPSITGIDKPDTDLLNITSENISDSSFIWMLAALASMDPNLYMALYQTTLKDGELIPVVGQEIATMVSYAFLLNNQVFESFAKAWNLALQKYAPGHCDKDLEEFFGSDSDYSINFVRTILNEGIAGSGKSLGIAKALIKLIQANPKTSKLLDNVWIVNTSESRAKALAEQLHLDLAKCKLMSHRDVMIKISGTNSTTGRSWNEIVDKDVVSINTEDLVFEDGKPILYNFPLADTEKPSLIITDEVSHMSLPSLLMLDKFCQKHGCFNLSFGDFDLAGIRLNLENPDIKKPDGSVKKIKGKYEGSVYNTNFIHPPKLGESLRTDNKFKDFNNSAFLAHMADYKAGRYDVKVNFKYSETPEYGLIGDKVLANGTVLDTPEFKSSIKEYIKNLLEKTIEFGNGAKLGYIYSESNVDSATSSRVIHSVIKELAGEERYKGLIDFKTASAALGEENPYYIINLNPTGDKERDVKNFYTGITRASRGTLIVQNGLAFLGFSTLDKSGKDSPITDTKKKEFIETKRKLYEKVYGESFDLPFIPPTSVKVKTSEVAPTTSAKTEEGFYVVEGDIITDDSKTYRVTAIDGEDITIENVDDPTDVKVVKIDDIKTWTVISRITDSKEIAKSNAINLDPGTLVDNSDPNKLERLHHSFNVDETGLVPNTTHPLSSDPYELGLWHEYRMDNAIGLLKMMGVYDPKAPTVSDGDYKLLQSMLRKIRSIARTAENETLLLNSIEQLLPENDFKKKFKRLVAEGKIKARFFYKVSLRAELFDSEDKGQKVTNPTPSTYGTKGFIKGRYYKPRNEKVQRYVDDTDQAQRENDATLSLMLIDENGKELFETPVSTDTNPITLAFSKGFDEEITVGSNKVSIAKFVLNERASGKRFMEILNNLQTALTTGDLKAHPQKDKLLGLIEAFIGTRNLQMGGQVKFLRNAKGEYLIPGRDWLYSGILLETDPSSTIIDELEFVEYTGETTSWKTLANCGLFQVSLKAYISEKDRTITLKNRTLHIKAGQPFIIVTDRIHEYTGFSDAKLWEELNRHPDRNDISIVYIEPPANDFMAYISLIDELYRGSTSKKGKEDLKGTTTSLRILETLLSSDEGKNFIKRRVQELLGPTDNIDEVFNTLEELVKHFTNITVTGAGKDNELNKAITSKLKDYPIGVSLDPLVLLCAFKSTSGVRKKVPTDTMYVSVFNRLVRTLALGYRFVDTTLTIYDINKSSTTSTDAIAEDDIKKVIDEFESLIKSKYKHGFFKRTRYKKDAALLIPGSEIVEADLTQAEIKIRGTLLTGAFITKDGDTDETKESTAYEKQRREARLNGVTSLPDSKKYELNDLKDVLKSSEPRISEDALKRKIIADYQNTNNVVFSGLIMEGLLGLKLDALQSSPDFIKNRLAAFLEFTDPKGTKIYITQYDLDNALGISKDAYKADPSKFEVEVTVYRGKINIKVSLIKADPDPTTADLIPIVLYLKDTKVKLADGSAVTIFAMFGESVMINGNFLKDVPVDELVNIDPNNIAVNKKIFAKTMANFIPVHMPTFSKDAATLTACKEYTKKLCDTILSSICK